MRKNFGAKPWVYPQPVLMIGTYDENGKPNLMNAAWGGQYDANQVMLCLSSHKTTDNIKVTGAFTVSFATASTVVPCDYVGIVSAKQEPNKMEKAGFTTVKSKFVNAPIINELPLTLECKFLKWKASHNRWSRSGRIRFAGHRGTEADRHTLPTKRPYCRRSHGSEPGSPPGHLPSTSTAGN